MRSSRPWPIVLMTRTLDLGGTERQVAEVARSLDPAYFRPTVVCFDAQGVRADELREAGVPVVEFPVRSFASPRTARISYGFLRWLRKNRVALVHPFDMPTVLYGVPMARVARVPVVLSSQRGDRRMLDRGQALLGVTDRLADAVVVNSDYIRRVLHTTFGVPDERMRTCRNGLDTSVFHANNRARRGEVNGTAPVVGIVAALRSEKSIETLIDACARIRPGALQLLIVGDGPSRASLEQRARDAGFDGRCQFVPSTLEVASWYRSIDVFVLPSTNESFSNSLMEAMACGCAVVASKVGGNPELVSDGENGLLFEAANAGNLARQLERLLQDSALRARLSAAAVRTIQSGYTREHSAEMFSSLYLRLLERTSTVVATDPQGAV
ncbi:MAG TPA: glycosyltransferase family 4 protein [Vicinamibacterales bacterium]|jgi:glycosyltransferase involved in cell wall biosynthesis|nr:glycosyltransferase family 4 protein [Vicinamibacterales bacterium]